MENPSRSATIFSGLITILLGISWGLAEYNVIPIDPKIFEPLLTVFGAITVLAGVFAFSTRDASDTETLSNRDLLIQAVQNNWIDDGKGNGFLQDALRDATIQIDMEGRPNQAGDSLKFRDYDLPIELVLREGNQRDNIKHSSDILRKTFEHVEKKLLILGEAGTGKSVLMLQLTETLLAEARDSHAPIPVVFNLASWAEERLSLTDWLKKRFKIDYGVSDKLATDLIAGDSLIYCLDGFDEVAENYRRECLVELNKFMTPTRQVVICSRIKEFEALAQPLNTKYAIEIQTLEDRQFKKLLQDNIPYPETVTKILKTLQTDNAVWQEIKKPLFANILINTYADAAPFPEHNIEGTTEQKVYALIIHPYITRQLQNKKPSQKNLDNALIPRYLAWIAYNLHTREQTVFYIEMLRVDWLPTKELRKYFRWVIVWCFALIFSLIFGLSIGLSSGLISNIFFGLLSGVIFGLLSGVIFGLLFGLRKIDLEQGIQFNLPSISSSIKSSWKNIIIFTMNFTLSFIMSLGLSIGLIFGLSAELSSGLTFGLSSMLIISVIFGVSFGLHSGLSNKRTISHRYNFNQGLQDTLSFGVSFGVSFGFISAIVFGLIFDVVFGLIFGLSISMSIALSSGLGEILKHAILRLMLEYQNIAPRRYDRFLEHVIERRIMRRVGGSAVFIHRYVLEYFAQ